MADLAALEKAAYEQVRETPFTRIHGKPSWSQKEKLIKEMESSGINQRVSYAWAGDWGCLAEIQGAQKYLVSTGEEYLAPARPPVNHPGVLEGNPSQTQIRIMTADNDLLKQDYHVLLGFRKGVGQNFRDAVDKKYHEQLKEPVFQYRRRVPLEYLVHLDTWVKLDERKEEILRKNYLRGWEVDEHITAFALRLDEEQTDLAANQVIISDAEKKRHYMLCIWDSGKYTRSIMTKWTSRPDEEKTYADAVTFFNEREAEIEEFEAASANTTKQHGLASANSVRESAIDKLLERLVERDEEKAAAAIEVNHKIEKLGEALLNINERLDRAESRPTRRRRAAKQVIDVSDSESESETESEEEPATPVKKRKRPTKKPKKEPKVVPKKEPKQESRRDRKKKKGKFKKGDDYKPGMKWDNDWEGEVKNAFRKSRREFQNKNPVEGKADYIKMVEEMLERAKAR